MSSPGRAVLTLATGKPLYLRLACNLARSFFRWHPDSDIRFAIATDLPCELEPALQSVDLIRLAPGELPKGFSAKLHVDRLAPADQTLFVDADCLCFGPLDSVFDRFAGRAVSVIGPNVTGGEWFGDVSALLRHFGLPHMPRFNGGVYYLEPGPHASAVYATARQIETQYDDLGLIRLRGRPNEELPMAVALALHGLTGIADDGTILSDPHACPGEVHFSVLRGRSLLVNPPAPDPRHRIWNALHVARPRIVHFLGDYTQNWRYRAEARKLALAARGWPRDAAEIFVDVTFGLPQRALEMGKDVGRPLYRRVFGVRPVKVSERIVT